MSFRNDILEENSSPQSTTMPIEQNRRGAGLIRQWVASAILTLSYLIVGTSVGWSSPVLYRMQETGEPINMTKADRALMVSLFYVGNFVMPVPGGVISDYRGRKECLIIFDSLALLSWVLIYFAQRPAMLHLARLLAGMWCGLVLTVVPLYVAEIAEPSVRGALMTLAQIMVNAGILLAYILGPRVSYWSLAIIFGIIPVIFSTLILLIPESPYWLIYKSAPGKSVKSLLWYRGCKNISDVEDEFRIMTVAVHTNEETHGRIKMLFSSKSNRKALIIVEVLSISQRLSGITAVVAYTSVTLPNKMVGALTPNDCTIFLGIVFMISPIIIIFLVDRIGRIPLLVTSCVGCGVSMFTLGLYYFLHQSTNNFVYHWIPLAAFICYGWAFNIGLGPLPTTMQGEMFPSTLKAVASGITVMTMAAASSFVNGVYFSIADNLGIFVNFLINTLAAVACAIFSCTYMFETKGKTLYEIQQKLSNS